ncbi:MAG: fluoride exporter [Gaiellaceae bacterium]|nr:fluoride exporter [Gaiellaceae bacterium]
MTVAVWLCVGLAGAAGSAARFLLQGAVGRRLGSRFPAGTLVVNLTGTLALGVLVGAALDGDTYRVAGTGFLGAYTTFSAWMLESRRLADDGEVGLAWANIVVSLAAGLAVAVLGRHIGTALA